MRWRTGFAEMRTYLILWSLIKHAHSKTSRVSVRNSALKAPALEQTNENSFCWEIQLRIQTH